jgi:hypothetical protein
VVFVAPLEKVHPGKHAIMAGVIGRLVVMNLAIDRDSLARSYMDQALTPVDDGDDATLDLLTMTTGAAAPVARSPRSPAPAGRDRGQKRAVMSSSAAPPSMAVIPYWSCKPLGSRTAQTPCSATRKDLRWINPPRAPDAATARGPGRRPQHPCATTMILGKDG